jgi:hypothetical protein
MGTALATIDTGTFLALQDGGAVAEAMAANLGEGAALREGDLTRVTIPTGGSTTWLVPSIMGDEPAKSIDGILVYQCVRGIVWPKAEPEEGSLPALVSHDLKTAHLVSDNLSDEFVDSIADAQLPSGEYDWNKLPQSQWGSGKDGNGKAAKEQRVLYILREGDPLPLVVVIQPGSLKNWQQFILAMTKAGIPYWRAVISLSLEKTTSKAGQPFSQVVPELKGVLTVEQGAVIREKFTEPMKAVAATSLAA